MANSDKKKVLLVDGEFSDFADLRQVLQQDTDSWDVVLAEDSQRAMELIEQHSFDASVSDVSVLSKDSNWFLCEAKTLSPDTGRLVLSGQLDAEQGIRAAGAAHQYLTKPCDAQCLKQAINRTLTVRGALKNEQLCNFVSEMSALPSEPITLARLAHALDDPSADDAFIGDIVADDSGVSTAVLQLVNNELLAVDDGVFSPSEAIDRVGPDIVRSLVSSMDLMERLAELGLSLDVFDRHWTHGLKVAAYAKQVSFAESTDSTMASEAFTAGMLHDLGRIILLANSSNYSQLLAMKAAEDSLINLCALEEKFFGVNHAQVGAYLLGLWGFPDSIVEAVLFHHHPRASLRKEFSPLTALHAANYIDHVISEATSDDRSACYSQSYLECVGCGDKMLSWLVLGSVCCNEGLIEKILKHQAKLIDLAPSPYSM